MELTSILLGSQSNNEKERDQCLTLLENAQSENLSLFLKHLCEELNNEESPIEARQLAGLILKNNLYSHDENRRKELADFWVSCKADYRQELKQQLFFALNSNSKQIRRTSAICVSVIASVEYPIGEWKSLFEDLIQLIEYFKNSKQVSEGVLVCLSFICEELGDENECSEISLILEPILNIIQQNEEEIEIRVASITTLLNSLGFVWEIFESKEDTQIIFNTIFSCIKNSENEQLIDLSFQCLVKIAYLYYPSLDPYMDDIFQVNMENVILQAIEFWSTICEEEISISEENEKIKEFGGEIEQVSKGYISTVSETLLPEICNLFVKQTDFSEEEEGIWNIEKATIVCLTIFSTIIGDQIFTILANFINDNLISDEWNKKDAAILTLGSIIEGVETDNFPEIIQNATKILSQYLTDNNIKVRHSTNFTFSQLFTYHLRPILEITTTDNNSNVNKNELLIKQIVQELLNSLSNEPYVASNSAWALQSLMIGKNECQIDEESFSMNFFSDMFIQIIEKLFETTEREDADEYNLRCYAYEALISILNNTPKNCFNILVELIEPFLSKLENSLKIEVLSKKEEIILLQTQGYLCGIIQSVISQLQNEILDYSGRIVQCLILVFNNKHSNSHEEAMMCINSLISALKLDFSNFLPKIHDYIIGGIQSYHEIKLCTLSLTTTTNLFRNFKKQFPDEYKNNYIEILITSINNPKINRDIHTSMIETFADIAISLEGDFEPYLEYISSILKQQLELNIDFKIEKDVHFLARRRNSILDLYTAMIQGFNRDKMGHLFLDLIPDLLIFIQQIANTPDEDRFDNILITTVQLIADILLILNKKVIHLFRTNYVSQLVKECITADDKEMNQVGLKVLKIFKKNFK
ncbi:importin subunit beta-1 [Anaeramoeba flamelloides]|uniref:Importin subunit beta-1 n=1 Tax=Anaeramoeba flamelloides TaxID=1746091 RepID=A0AAV7YIK2_9EUKA|nr:importin subunit beta-1 [Anaeramoeba flamelloides]